MQSGNKAAVTFDGHAKYGQPGSDIVCSAVSALYYALAIGLQKLAPGSVSTDGKMIELTEITPETKGAMTTVFAGLRAIAETYPDNVTVICPSGV